MARCWPSRVVLSWNEERPGAPTMRGLHAPRHALAMVNGSSSARPLVRVRLWLCLFSSSQFCFGRAVWSGSKKDVLGCTPFSVQGWSFKATIQTLSIHEDLFLSRPGLAVLYYMAVVQVRFTLGSPLLPRGISSSVLLAGWSFQATIGPRVCMSLCFFSFFFVVLGQPSGPGTPKRNDEKRKHIDKKQAKCNGTPVRR